MRMSTTTNGNATAAVLLALTAVILLNMGCDDDAVTAGGQGYEIEMFPETCRSTNPFWEDFVEEWEAAEQSNLDASQAAEQELSQHSYEMLDPLVTISYPDMNVNAEIEQLFDSLGEDWEPLDLPEDGIGYPIDFSHAVWGPYSAVYNGEDISFVIARNLPLVRFEDGTIGPLPGTLSVAKKTNREVAISGAKLFDECENTGLHCDPQDWMEYYLYDVSGVAASDIGDERIVIEYERIFIHLAFDYSKSGGKSLAPTSLTTEQCISGGITEITEIDE